jgi:hypothetical protein
MNKYVERLTKEWIQHKKIVIAIDYDSTVFPWHTIDNKEDMNRAISILKKASEIGAFLVINTCSDHARYKEITEYCNSIELSIDGINTNPIELPYGKSGKIYANIYLDDRAGLLEALDILEKAMYGYIGYIKTNNLKM